MPKTEKKASVFTFTAAEPIKTDSKTATENSKCEDVIMADSAPTEQSIKIDFDTILKDLKRDEEEILHGEQLLNSTDQDICETRKRSVSKERNFSKKFIVEEEKAEAAPPISRQDLLLPLFRFDIFSGRGKGDA
jgi:hypothetical protein